MAFNYDWQQAAYLHPNQHCQFGAVVNFFLCDRISCDNRYYETIDGKTTDITEEIPFDIPDSWAWCRFRSICSEINVGIVIQPTRYYTTPENGIPAFRNANIRPNKIDDSNWIYLNKAGINENPRCIVHTDDLLISRSGNAGICCVASQKYNGYGAVDILIATLLSPYSQPKYYSFCINSNNVHQVILQMNRGVALSHIGVNSLVDVLLPIPPLAEQKRIVSQIEALFAEVDKIDKDSADLESALTLAKQKVLDLAIRGKLVPQNPDDEPASELLKRIKAEKEALVKAGKIKKDKHESFIFKGDDNCYHENIDGKVTDITDEIPFELANGWSWCRLNKVASLADGDWIESKDQAPTGFRLIQTGNIGECVFLPHDERARYISQETFLNLNCTEIFPGDCLISRLPDPLGRACIIPDSQERMITAVDCTITRPYKSGLSSLYFMYFTGTTIYNEYVEKNATGSTRKRISRANLDKVLIPLPPLTEQKRIVSQVEKLFAVLETMRG